MLRTVCQSGAFPILTHRIPTFVHLLFMVPIWVPLDYLSQKVTEIYVGSDPWKSSYPTFLFKKAHLQLLAWGCV